MNNFIIEEKCPYCYHNNWLPVGLTNPDRLLNCDNCYYIFPINPNGKNYELLEKYYLKM